MSIEFRCTECNTQLRVPESAVGRQVRCPSCQTIQELTEAESPPLDETQVAGFTPHDRPQPEPAAPVERTVTAAHSSPAPQSHLPPHRGGLILILGILSLTCCGCFTGVPAIIMGMNDLGSMRNGRMDPDGSLLTKIGIILGVIGLIPTVIVPMIATLS